VAQQIEASKTRKEPCRLKQYDSYLFTWLAYLKTRFDYGGKRGLRTTVKSIFVHRRKIGQIDPLSGFGRLVVRFRERLLRCDGSHREILAPVLESFVSGHGFSHAAKCTRRNPALARTLSTWLQLSERSLSLLQRGDVTGCSNRLVPPNSLCGPFTNTARRASTGCTNLSSCRITFIC
jgi:hypothetical protein